MSFTDAIRTCFQKYVTFEGRAKRPEFWWFALFCFLGSSVFGILDRAIFGPDASVLGPVFGLATVLPALAVGARRLHDIGRTGWWLLLSLIPVIGTLVLLFFFVQPSDKTATA